jgi:hypothetical protein
LRSEDWFSVWGSAVVAMVFSVRKVRWRRRPLP